MKSKLNFLEINIPKLVLAPTFLITIIFIYGFIAWNFILSLTTSKLLPIYTFAGLKQYYSLFDNSKWWLAMENLLIFSFLFISFCLIIGLLLAILIDQKIKFEAWQRVLYSVFLEPHNCLQGFTSVESSWRILS
jgi:glucose/mannose transport system permease protein